jgi:hypothetical protein
MRATEFLFEGSGLRAAKAGEIYVDANETEFKFQSWNWQFPSNAPAFENEADLEQGVLSVVGGDQNKMVWANSPRGNKSFGYAVFASDAGEELWIGKFYRAKNPNNTILDKEVKQFLGLVAGGKSSAVKAEAALQPGQLGIADNRARSVGGIRGTGRL